MNPWRRVNRVAREWSGGKIGPGPVRDIVTKEIRRAAAAFRRRTGHKDCIGVGRHIVIGHCVVTQATGPVLDDNGVLCAQDRVVRDDRIATDGHLNAAHGNFGDQVVLRYAIAEVDSLGNVAARRSRVDAKILNEIADGLFVYTAGSDGAVFRAAQYRASGVSDPLPEIMDIVPDDVSAGRRVGSDDPRAHVWVVADIEAFDVHIVSFDENSNVGKTDSTCNLALALRREGADRARITLQNETVGSGRAPASHIDTGGIRARTHMANRPVRVQRKVADTSLHGSPGTSLRSIVRIAAARSYVKIAGQSCGAKNQKGETEKKD